MWKEFLQLRRDPLLLRLLFLLPVLQLVMMGYVVGADVKNLSTAVVDLDRTVTSRRLADSFRKLRLLHDHPAPGQGERPAAPCSTAAR